MCRCVQLWNGMMLPSICWLSLPLQKHWGLEKLTSIFSSFMPSYNVLDKVWLLWGDLRQGDAKWLVQSDTARSNTFSSAFFLVLPAFLIHNFFSFKLFSWISQHLPVHFKHLCFCLLASSTIINSLSWGYAVLRRQWTGIDWYFRFSWLTHIQTLSWKFLSVVVKYFFKIIIETRQNLPYVLLTEHGRHASSAAELL